MPKFHGTATAYILSTLTRHADREFRVSDLHELCEGQYQKANLVGALQRLADAKRVVRIVEGPREVWWAIA